MAVGVAAFAWLHRFPGDPPLMGSDGSIWFDLARNCVELGRCPTFGAPSSMHLDTGHAWIDLQMLVQLAHGSSLAERAVVFALGSSRILAMPKSSTFTPPSRGRNTLAGLMSR